MIVLTEEQIGRLLGALSAGGEMALAARIVGISRSSLYNILAADPELKDRVNEARAQADEVVIKSLYTEATQNHDVTAMIFWLKNRRPQEWRDRREHAFVDMQTNAERIAAEIGADPEELLSIAKQITGGVQ